MMIDRPSNQKPVVATNGMPLHRLPDALHEVPLSYILYEAAISALGVQSGKDHLDFATEWARFS